MKELLLVRAEQIIEELRDEGCYIDLYEAMEIAEREWHESRRYN